MEQLQAGALYSGVQWRVKKTLLAGLARESRKWNSQARQSARSQQIEALEQSRQKVQNDIFDSKHDIRILAEREGVAEPSVDARFISLSGMHCTPAYNFEAETIDSPVAESGDVKDYLFNRILGGNSLLEPVPSVLDDETQVGEVQMEEKGRLSSFSRHSPNMSAANFGTSNRSQSPLRRVGSNSFSRSVSPLRRGTRSRSQSPLASARDALGYGQDSQEKTVRESEEALWQILGLPSQTEQGEISRKEFLKQAHKVTAVGSLARTKTRRHAPIVYRTRYSVMTHEFLCQHEEREKNTSFKGKGLDTPFGKPMEVLRPCPVALEMISCLHDRKTK